MRVLIFGDIFGRIGRKAFKKHLGEIKDKYLPDFTVVNIENMTSGRGPILKHILELNDLGDIDVFTSGDHITDNLKDIKGYLEMPNSKLIRPANFYESEYYKFPGKGYKIVEKKGFKILVINLLGEAFLSPKVYNPFFKIDEILEKFKNENLNGIILDFHREATAEIYCMANFLDGRISFLYGTHTHVQTNDELIFPAGTGIISDIGMSGAIYSSIGIDFESVKPKIFSGTNIGRMKQSLDKNYIVNACIVDIDENNGKCKKIQKIRIRGELH